MDYWMEMLFLLGFPTLFFVVVIICVVLWLLVFPKPAKTMIMAKVKKRTLALIANSAYRWNLIACKVWPEGVMESSSKKDREVYCLPTTIIEGDHVNDDDKQELMEMESAVMRPCLLEGLGSPIYIGFAGKAVAANPQTLLSLQHRTNEVTVRLIGDAAPSDEKVEIPLNGNVKDQLKRLTKRLKQRVSVVAKILLPLDPRVLVKYKEELWDQSQIDSLLTAHEDIGREEERKSLREWILPLLIIGCVLIAGCVIIVFFGGG